MDFFQHQDRARRNTQWLVALFALAVAGIGLLLYLLVRLFQLYMGARTEGIPGVGPQVALWDPGGIAMMILGTFVLVGGLSLAKMLTLREGGAAVARMMGATAVDPGATDAGERRLRNVVEEMAIASGTPVPAVFVLEEEGINAFAAGWSPNDAAVAVTRGALNALNRDQLQGVIAHEFSHILNGDMRLNIRMIGVIFGILAIAIAGRWALETRRVLPRKAAGGAVVAGIALWVIGYVGVLAGRILQAAISRQREFLADASAVQFTRNPAGIGGALKRIAGSGARSYLHAPATEEVGHLLFGAGRASNFLGQLFATHPPLEERIRRVDPSFAGDLSLPPPAPAPVPGDEASGRAVAAPALGDAASGRVGAPVSSFSATPRPAPDPAPAPAGMTASAVMQRIGTQDAGALAEVHAIAAQLPPELHRSLESAAGAAKVVCAALLHEDGEGALVQFRILDDMLGPDAPDEVSALRASIAAVGPALRLALVELAVPALRRADEAERRQFLKVVDDLVAADRRLELFEFVVRRLLERRLLPGPRAAGAHLRHVDKVAWNAAHVLAAMARAGQPTDGEAATRAFRAGLDRLKTALAPRILEAWARGGLGDLPTVGESLDRLRLATPEVLRTVVDALIGSAFTDGRVTFQEGELLRVVAVSLDCPMPPFHVAIPQDPEGVPITA